MLKRSFLFALGLGIATSAVIGLLDTYLPYSETKIRVMDAVAVLGALLAGLGDLRLFVPARLRRAGDDDFD